jgi:penicillin-binding protein 1A
VAGGDLPAELWRRFMMAAHEGLAPRDFAFLGGAANGQAAPEGPGSLSRAAFYQGLAADFARTAQSDGAAQPATTP